MSRNSLSRAVPTNENAPPSSHSSSAPSPAVGGPRNSLIGKMKSINNVDLSARRSSPRLSAAREANQAMTKKVLGERGMGVRVEIQAPTSDGSASWERGESRIPVSTRKGSSQQSLTLPSSQPKNTPRSRSASKPRPTASPALQPPKSATKRSTPVQKSRRKSAGKLLATPNQTFDEAPSTPDSEGDDPLLLKSAQTMRGWGEGKPRREGSWGGSSAGRRGSASARRSESAGKERSESVRKERSASVIDRERGGEVWGDDALAPLGSGGLLSDHDHEHEQDEEVDPNADWKDEDYHFNFPSHSAASLSSPPRPHSSHPLDLHSLHPHPHDPDDSLDADETLEIDSPIAARSASVRPIHRDYSVPVLFTSPDSTTRKRARRPSSPAPARKRSSSEPDGSTASPGAASSVQYHSPPRQSVSPGVEQEDTTMEMEDELVEPKLESSSQGKDAFDSSSSTGSEQQLAEEERWKGPIMSEDSTELPSELDEVEEDEEAEESRTVSEELLSGSRGTTPRNSPTVEEMSKMKEAAVGSPGHTQRDTTMIFSPFPPPRRTNSSDLQATKIVHFRESAPIDSLLLSAPPPPPPAPVAQSPVEYTTRRQSTVLPTPQVARHRSQPNPIRAGSTAQRPRPSHPSLPVIEISSTDPRAAAEAVAFLKIRHGYHERGLEFPRVLVVGPEDGLTDEGGRRGSRRGSAMVERDLQGLLVEAERSVSARLSAGEARRTASPTPDRLLPPTRHSSVLADFGSSSRIPSPMRNEMPEKGVWTAVHWRALERALIEERRVAKSRRRELVPKDVIENFLRGQEMVEDGTEGDWSWTKLETRLGALRQRRARDSQSRSRASSMAASPNPTTLAAEIGRATLSRFNFGAVLKEVVNFSRRRGVSKEPAMEEEEEEDEEEEDSSDGERNEEEDTFFERARPSRLPSPERLPSAPPIALASARHAHLYDDPVEKPPLPVESWQGGYRVKTEELDEDAMMETLRDDSRTSEDRCDEEMGIPSSARRLVSYLGSFVRRSAAPELSSPATRQYDPPSSPSSSSSEPERIDDTISLALLRSNLRPVLPTPHKRHPLSQRLSYPPAQARRRSSGEGMVQDSINAIESAESSREEGVLPFDLLASASGSLGSGFLRKRVASESDLRGSARRGCGLDSPSMIPSGTRALDRQYELSKGKGKA